ncbi:MAG: PQQ-binding-like beta-propeller repeat protein, partial [Armatimonadota bacterium]
MKKTITLIAALALVLASLLPAPQCRAADGSHDALAKEILAATGVKGGFVTHVGCGDGKLTAALRANDSYLVHGLDRDPSNVGRARDYIRSLKLNGKVSVDRLRSRRLPYIDNMANLLVSEDLGPVAMGEVMRVLSPNGVAYVKRGGEWEKTVKPRPEDIDEWTHYLHDPSNNAVAHDSVIGPPRHLQWVGSPRWSRHHDHMSSTSAMVSANGRVFYIFDEGPKASIELPPNWLLTARDAFNGTVLWKRPLGKWHTHLWPLKSGPAQLPRRLVAIGDTVYVTLAIDAPLTALDGATGETIRTYEGTQSTEEILFSDGVLFLLVNEGAGDRWESKASYASVAEVKSDARERTWDAPARTVMAVAADGGKILWRSNSAVSPLTLAADGQRVYFHDGGKIVALDRKSGEQAWVSEPLGRWEKMATYFGPTLV